MNKLIKKILSVFLIICVVLQLFACGNKENVVVKDENKFVITTTIFPIYDFVKNITKDVENVEVNMLIDTGIDLHNFQPSAKDIMTIKNSDMFIYIGGESDEWVDATLETANNTKLDIINLIEEMMTGKNNDLLKLEPDAAKISGVVDDEEHEYEHEHEDDAEYDEHIWLSLRNAKVIVGIIAERILANEKIKGSDAELFILKNTSNYKNDLQVINKKFDELLDIVGGKVMVVADRFPFIYFCEDYGIEYYAAFKGCSSQTEASFQTIKFLVEKVDKYNLKSIFKIEKSDTKIADTIISTTKNKNQNILTLNSIQQVTKDEINNGTTYISLMIENYNVLSEYFK